MTSITQFTAHIVGADKGVGLQLAYLLQALKYSYRSLSLKESRPQGVADFVVLAPSIFSSEELDDAQQWAVQLQQRSSCVILLSSLAVFPDTPCYEWQESDEASADTLLARQLLALETAVQACPRGLILRTGLPFSLQGNDFSAQLIQQVRAKNDLILNDSVAFCPTAMSDVAAVILAVMQQVHCAEMPEQLYGVYHCAGVESVSAFQFAQALLAEAARHEDLPAIQIRATDDGGWLPSLWVPCGDNTKLFHQFGIRPKSWRQSLERLFKS